MSEAALLRQMPVLETQAPTRNAAKRDSRRWSLTALLPNSLIRSARPTEQRQPCSSPTAASPQPVVQQQQQQQQASQSRQSIEQAAAAAASTAPPPPPPPAAASAAKQQRRNARRSSWAASSFTGPSTSNRRLSLNFNALNRASSHVQSTSEAATLVEPAARPSTDLLVKPDEGMDDSASSLRLTLTASTHSDGFYRTSEPIEGFVSLPRFDRHGREVRSVKVELFGTMNVHLLHEVPANPLSGQTKTVPRSWRSNFHHQLEQLLAPSDVRTTQAHIKLPLRFVLPERTINVISRLGTPLPPSMRVGVPPSESFMAGAFSMASAAAELESPSAEIKYELFVHVKREGAAHKLKGLVPAKRENLVSVLPVLPHATRPTVPVREIGLLPLPVETESVAQARQRRRSSMMATPSTPPISGGGGARSTSASASASYDTAATATGGDSRRSSMSSDVSRRMSFAMQRESGLSLMETSQGLQGWTAHRLTSQLNGRGNVEVEISWPAQTALPLGAWVPFSLKTLLPSEVSFAGGSSTSSSVRLTLLRAVRSASAAGTLTIEENRVVPLDVRLDASSSGASPPGDEYGSASTVMGKMRVCEGTDAHGQSFIPSFSFKRLRVEYTLVLTVSLRSSASPRSSFVATSATSRPASMPPLPSPASAMTYSVTLQAPVQVVCDADVLATLAERRQRRASSRVVRNAVDTALARLEGRAYQPQTQSGPVSAPRTVASVDSSVRPALVRTSPVASSMSAAILPAQLTTPTPMALAPPPSPGALALRRSSSSNSNTNAADASSGSSASAASPRRSFADRVPVTYPADIAPSAPQRSPSSSRSPSRSRSSSAASLRGSSSSSASHVAARSGLAVVPSSPTLLSSLSHSTQTQPSAPSAAEPSVLARQESCTTLRAPPTPAPCSTDTVTNAHTPLSVLSPLEIAPLLPSSLRARMSSGSIFSDCSISTSATPASPGAPPSYLCSVQPR